MASISAEQLTQAIGAPVEANVGLAQFSTFKLGGPAEFFVRAKTAEIFKQAIAAALTHNLPYTILGKGANVLIADKGISGLVIRAEDNDIVIDGQIVRAGAGAAFAQVAVKSSQAGLAGLEFAASLPGSVGGAVRGNAGCFGSEVKDVLLRAHVLNIPSSLRRGEGVVGATIVSKPPLPLLEKEGIIDLWLDNKDCKFAYRESRFKHEQFIILEAEFKLAPGNKDESIDKISKFLEQKKSTQSVESNCAGCMFKNVAWQEWEKIPADKLKSEDIDDSSQFKAKGVVPTGWIIEQLGLKGYRIGDTMVSEKHGNFLLNMGKATTGQMIQLISYLKMQVRDRLGIMLQEEVQYLGF